MFYGVETRKGRETSEKNRYTPWSGSPMAGTMDLLWQGKAITLRRFPKGSSPFGGFQAVYTGTEEPVPGLTADNAGQTLLGFGKEVFERTCFIGQGAMAFGPSAELEQRLANMRVEVHRWMNVTNQFLRHNGQRNMHVKIQDLCQYEMGPTATANIWWARECAERGFDGLIHIKSASCTPEIDVMPVLQNISGDYKIPVLYLTYDAQTSDVGLMTRLEAFYDMIAMRKKVL